MIRIVYNYRCTCGYHCVQQEKVQTGAYIRLLIDAVVLCPDCKQRLQPQVLVAYAARSTAELALQATEQDERPVPCEVEEIGEDEINTILDEIDVEYADVLRALAEK
jgi:hypothetical protein